MVSKEALPVVCTCCCGGTNAVLLLPAAEEGVLDGVEVDEVDEEDVDVPATTLLPVEELCWLVGRMAAVRAFCTDIGLMLAKGVSPPRQGVTVADCWTEAVPDMGLTFAVRGDESDMEPFSEATDEVEGLADCCKPN